MSDLPAPRAHLVERALEAMGASQGGKAMFAAPPPRRPFRDLPTEGVDAPEEQAKLDGVVVLERPAPEVADAPPKAPLPAPAITMARLQAAGLAFATGEAPRGRVAEEFSLVQQQLLRIMQAGPTIGAPASAANTCRRAVMVTSARRREGRSFVALNLAASIAARTQHQVVLIDLDGGDTSLSHVLDVAVDPGATRVSQPLAVTPVATAIDRLSFLPHHALLPDVAKPGGPAMAAALRALAGRLPNHLLVLDTKPALSSSDVNALAATVGHVVMVVRAEETQRDEVEAALDAVEACMSLHLMLNRTRLVTSDSFGTHGEHGAPSNA